MQRKSIVHGPGHWRIPECFFANVVVWYTLSRERVTTSWLEPLQTFFVKNQIIEAGYSSNLDA